MSSARTKKMRPQSANGSQYTLRKREKIPLHDEADLVNFRADQLARLMNNHDFLENASLKLFHTAHIAPPSVFPTQTKKLYEDTATDEELQKIVDEMAPEELYSGDLRLMRAKLALLQKQGEELSLEQVPSLETTFGDEMRFQREALNKLAAIRNDCKDFRSMARMEEALTEILTENEQKFSKKYVLQQDRFRKHSIPLKELVPDLVVQQAPPLYNPKLITSYLEMKGDDYAQKQGGNGLKDDSNGANGSNPNNFMSDSAFDDIGIMLGGEDRIDQRPSSGWSNGPSLTAGNGSEFLKADAMSYALDFDKNLSSEFPGGSKMGGNPRNKSTDNMVDLNQFLTDGGVDGGIDEMDALMNFDGVNNTGPDAGEEAFDVDFLNDMGMDLN